MFLSSDLQWDFGGALSSAFSKAREGLSTLTQKVSDLLPIAQQATDIYKTVESISSGSSSPARAATSTTPTQQMVTTAQVPVIQAGAPSPLSNPLILLMGGGLILFLVMGKRRKRGRR